jgi:hypothetical protein
VSSPAPTELHAALARLATDARARRDPAWLAALPLENEDRATLEAIPTDALERYAESLLDKRVSELVDAIPHAARAFPPLLAHYRSWLADNPAPPSEDVLTPGLREALRALPVLAALVEPDWLSDALKFEVLSGCSRRDGLQRTLRSRWALAPLLAELRDGEIPLDPDEHPTLHRFP